MYLSLTQQQRMNLATQFAQYRKQRGMTQAQLADALGVHVTQIKRYEAGTSQPSVDGIKKIAILLNVSADELLFGEEGRDLGEKLRRHFAAVSKLPDDEQRTVISVIEGLILKHEARRWE
jgi:transcriptional regulator with XRE-family HTH domain